MKKIKVFMELNEISDGKLSGGFHSIRGGVSLSVGSGNTGPCNGNNMNCPCPPPGTNNSATCTNNTCFSY